MTNLVILVGRIARDPETRTTQGGTNITSISVVTDRPARKDGKTYKDENGYTAKDSEFHRVTCFNGLGQNVAKYCTKGQLVTVEGRIHYTQWEDQDGAKRYGCEIIAETVDATVLPSTTLATSRRSSIRPLVQEPMKTRSTAMSVILVPATRPIYSNAACLERRLASSA